VVEEADVAATPEAAGDMIFVIVLAVDWGMLLSIVIAALTVIRLAVLKSLLGLLLPSPPPPDPPPLHERRDMLIINPKSGKPTHFSNFIFDLPF
jgi:hypothetical protein